MRRSKGRWMTWPSRTSYSMTRKQRDRRGLDEILASTSDVLFPAEMGLRKIELDTCDVDGDTPLHVMLWRSDNYAAEVLIEAGIDVNAVGDMGETPLHIAIRKENARLIRALLDAGAKIDIRSEFGQTAIDMLNECSLKFRERVDAWFDL